MRYKDFKKFFLTVLGKFYNSQKKLIITFFHIIILPTFNKFSFGVFQGLLCFIYPRFDFKELLTNKAFPERNSKFSTISFIRWSASAEISFISCIVFIFN